VLVALAGVVPASNALAGTTDPPVPQATKRTTTYIKADLQAVATALAAGGVALQRRCRASTLAGVKRRTGRGSVGATGQPGQDLGDPGGGSVGAVRLSTGRFERRRPSSSAIVRSASYARRSRCATTSGTTAARSTTFGPC
jgi:hypothetical protein